MVKIIKMLLLFRFFFIHRDVLEINKLPEHLSVGGAIADLLQAATFRILCVIFSEEP